MTKNITNGEFDLDIDADDRVNDNYKFLRVPGGDIYDQLRRHNPNIQTNYYIENIRTGSFSQISEKYMIQSQQQKQIQDDYTTDSFQTEMGLLRQSLQEKIRKAITFIQGIFVGMALLFTITLNLSTDISQALVRVQDQSIRVVALLSAFGALHACITAKQKYDYIKTRGTGNEIDLKYKALVLCIIELVLYFISYCIFNASHSFAVFYNINQTNYEQLKTLTTIYTGFCVLGWLITNANTYKHES